MEVTPVIKRKKIINGPYQNQKSYHQQINKITLAGGLEGRK